MGAVVTVIAGTVNAGTTWRTTNTTAPVIDTDDILWEANEITGAELNIEGGQSVISAHGNTGATETIDPTAGNVHSLTLDAACTITLNNPVGSGACTLELWVTQDGTGGRGITWPGSVVEIGTHDTTAGTTQRCIVETIDGGTSWVATWIGGGEPTADAHIADTTDAHDASAISIADAGGYYTGTDVEAALQEIGADLAAGTGGGASEHAHIVSETHLSDGSGTTYTLDQFYEPGSVIAWNTTSLARLGVTEVPPDQATVSAAGTSGDSILFDYAATLGA
jgi:hypothetical protein